MDIYIGVGSNIQPGKYIPAAIGKLRQTFGELLISNVYESEAVGFAGDNFYNLVIGLKTELAPHDIVEALNEIEDSLGRKRDIPKYSARTLDLDLLLYGDMVKNDEGLKLPRQDIIKYAFVLRPLAEIAGDMQHPVDGRSLKEIWDGFPQDEQELWKVTMKLKET